MRLLVAADQQLLRLAHILDRKAARSIKSTTVEPLIEVAAPGLFVCCLFCAAMLSINRPMTYIGFVFWIGCVAFMGVGLSSALFKVGPLSQSGQSANERRDWEAAAVAWSFIAMTMIYPAALLWWRDPVAMVIHGAVILSLLLFAWLTFLMRPEPPKRKRRTDQEAQRTTSLLERLGLLPSFGCFLWADPRVVSPSL